MDVTVIMEQGTHLLIAGDGRFAVIERRNDRLYNCHDGKREGIPFGDLTTVSKILDKGDWTDRATAQATFDEITARGSEFAQRIR